MSRLGKALVFILLLILVAGVALDQWRVNRLKQGSRSEVAAANSDVIAVSNANTTSATLPAAIDTEKSKVDLNCESYHYSTCPEGCERVCTASVCSTDICTADCDGPGSCKAKP